MASSISMAKPVEAESSFVSDNARQAEAVSVSASTPVADGPPSGGDRPKWASSEFGAIYQEHSPQIYYGALRFRGDPTQAEAATHDVVLKAARQLVAFR